MRIKETLSNLLNKISPKISEKWSSFSERERFLVYSCVGIFLFLGTYLILDSINQAFSAQKLRLEAAETELKTLPPVLINYTRLKERKNVIERKYKEVQIQEGALSLLEKLVKEKAEATPDIKDKTSPFGNSYIQRTFTLKFKVTKVDNLINFLNEVVKGSKPLLLTRLNILRSINGERLDVEADISSIEPKGKDDQVGSTRG